MSYKIDLVTRLPTDAAHLPTQSASRTETFRGHRTFYQNRASSLHNSRSAKKHVGAPVSGPRSSQAELEFRSPSMRGTRGSSRGSGAAARGEPEEAQRARATSTLTHPILQTTF